jgi:putative transposase
MPSWYARTSVARDAAAVCANASSVQARFRSRTIASTHDQIANVFSRRPSQDTAAKFHSARSQAFTIWAEVTGVAMVA